MDAPVFQYIDKSSMLHEWKAIRADDWLTLSCSLSFSVTINNNTAEWYNHYCRTGIVLYYLTLLCILTLLPFSRPRALGCLTMVSSSVLSSYHPEKSGGGSWFGASACANGDSGNCTGGGGVTGCTLAVI